MRSKLIGLFFIAMSMPLPAAAQDADFRTIKCKEFIAAPDQQKGILLTFVAGYVAGRAGVPILYRDKMVKMGVTIGAHCAANMDDNIMKAAGIEM